MRLELQLMGSPQLQLDHVPVTAGRRAVIALLAYLTVSDIDHPHQRHTRESLAALLWPDYDQTKALANLRHTLWEVSQSIGDGWIVAEHEAVYLNPGAEITLDVARFFALLRDASQQSSATLRLSLLEEAMQLYRGPFMTGFSLKDATEFNEWLLMEAENVRRALTSLLTMLVEGYLALGQAKSAIPHAQRLIALEPFNEAAHRQLMHLYALTDQMAAALQTYQMLEKALRKELNLDPQPETRELYKKIRKGDFRQITSERETVGSSRSLPKQNLPLTLTTFVGREKEREEIIRLIAQNRLVTLIGAGGIGKTRLSLQVGHDLLDQYPDGVWFVPLDSLADEKLVPQRFASFFGVVETPGQTVVETLVAALRGKIMLVILDNCEHVLESSAQLAETLLKSCPHIKILATSREVLGLEGECFYAVPSLAIPEDRGLPDPANEFEALRLFVERSRLVSPHFNITGENAPAILEICSQLDGIPLAIEFAAARVDVLRVEEILEQLSHSFDLLAGSKRSLSPRQQTLRASINWSWNLLTSMEHILMRRLSVFAGGWTFHAARAVCECQDLEWISSLVKKSLVVVNQEGRHETRYSFHTLVRKFAQEKLVEAGEEHEIRDRHLEYFLDLARKLEPALRGVDQLLWLERLFVERDNLRAAMQWAARTNVQAGLYLSGRLQAFWENVDLPEDKRWLLMI